MRRPSGDSSTLPTERQRERSLLEKPCAVPEGASSDLSRWRSVGSVERSEEHTSELQSQSNLVCRLLLEKKKKNNSNTRFGNKTNYFHLWNKAVKLTVATCEYMYHLVRIHGYDCRCAYNQYTQSDKSWLD